MTTFRAFRHPSFRLLWTVVILCQLGYWFALTSFQWVVAQRTDNDPFALGLLYFCSFAPFLLFSLPAGVLADSRDRRRMLISVQAAAVTLAVAATVLATLGSLPTPAVLVLGFVAGSVITVLAPASHALTANLVPIEDLSSAVPLQSAGVNLARIAGPALVGPVILVGGPTGALGIYALLSITATALTVSIATVAIRPNSPVKTERLGQRLTAGMRHAGQRPPAVAALGVVAGTSLFGASYMSQMPILGARVSADGATAFLLLVTLAGLGSLIGVLFVARRGRLHTLSPALMQVVTLGVVVTLFGVTRSFALMALLVVMAGGLTFSIMTSINTLLQHLVDDAQRGRVLSLYFISWGGLSPVGGLGLGTLTGAVGPSTAFLLYGAAAVFTALAIWPLTRRNGGSNDR